ncbi:GNAT family N-acyltransferase [Ghiorsea bivora]|uniref:GNAT family N-acyltransferase n=1 Tax=Ghiorsea bivora TaxID=1485545 RepID=UPI00056DA26C|nr:lysophospholipid acyltransferase family protein [Ghiorsea bivora]
MLDIDQVVTKNFPKVAAKPWLFSKPVKSALRMLFHERELQKFQAQYPHLQGLDFVEQILEHFDFSYTINAKELERIPSTGRVVIVANHPLGTLDAAVLLKLVGQVRTDVKAVANQVLSSIQPIHGLLLPVDNMGGNTKPSQLKAVYQHLQHEGAVIIFPAGEVSRLSPSGIKDGKWNRSFLQIASASRAPILPIYVNGRNSAFFYALSWLARPLSTLWLVREMYKQAKRSVAVSIGKLIPVEALEHVKLPMDAKAKLMKKHLYRLGSHKPALFESISPIAHPEKRQALRQELQACELLGKTQDGKQIYLAEYHADSSLMREIGRLREIAFRAVGEGTGSRRDVDKYDSHCFQLVLWDEQDLEIVGAYRLCKIQEVLQTNPNDTPLYSQTLFHFSPAMQPMMEQGLELGRSFVQPRYWGRRSLDYLWYGIGAFLRQHPEYRYLLGPVSLSDHYQAAAKDLLVYFYTLYFGDKDCKVTAKLPYRIAPHTQEELAKQFSGQDYKKDFMHLKSSLKHMGCTVPTLYKQYTEICQPEGVHFLGFNIDPDFANCIDGLVVVDLTRLHEKTRKRYITWEVK